MAQQVISLGTNPNDHLGEQLRAGGSAINNNFTEIYNLQSQTINAGAVDYNFTGATFEQRIALADADAVLRGFSRIYIPAFMLPYDITLCPASAGVQRVREGGNAASWDILAYGATPNVWPIVPTADSSASIQAIVNTGHDVDFVGQFVKMSNITQNTDNQVLYSSTGIANILKGANGPILSCAGVGTQLWNIALRGGVAGADFTGDNVVFSGQNSAMLNCGSRYAAGRAVRATGGHFQMLGTCDIYQTVDVTPTGYDVEIGVSGTATLYHRLWGIYTSVATGGILFTDTGSQSVADSQFGKLTVVNGTGPAGVNGGSYVSNRILGNTTIGISTAEFAANHFGPIVFTVNAGVSGIQLDVSNTFQTGATLINNGTAACAIIRSVGTSGTIDIKYGQDSSAAVMKWTPGTGSLELPNTLVLPNNLGSLYLKSSSGAQGATVSLTGSDNLSVVGWISGKAIQIQQIGNGTIQFYVNSVNQLDINATRSLFGGNVDLGSGKVYKVNNVQVVSAQGAAVADATDAASVITQLNLLLARCRAHGLIA